MEFDGPGQKSKHVVAFQAAPLDHRPHRRDETPSASRFGCRE